jgi:hypothetical protein
LNPLKYNCDGELRSPSGKSPAGERSVLPTRSPQFHAFLASGFSKGQERFLTVEVRKLRSPRRPPIESRFAQDDRDRLAAGGWSGSLRCKTAAIA